MSFRESERKLRGSEWGNGEGEERQETRHPDAEEDVR